MAFKVGTTSVISGSRVLENVTGLKTVNSTSLLGSGNIAVSEYEYIGSVKNSSATGQGYSSSLTVQSGDLLIINVLSAGGSAFGDVLIGTTSQLTYASLTEARLTANTSGSLTCTQTGASANTVRCYVDVYRE